MDISFKYLIKRVWQDEQYCKNVDLCAKFSVKLQLTVLVDFILVQETVFTNIRPVYAVYAVLR